RRFSARLPVAAAPVPSPGRLLALLVPACLLLACFVSTRAAADDLLAEAAHDEAEAELRVHAVMVAALANDRDGTARAPADFEALDRARKAAGLHASGLLDDLRRLAAAVEPTRAARRAALEALLDDDPDKDVEHHARYALDSDDAARAE